MKSCAITEKISRMSVLRLIAGLSAGLSRWFVGGLSEACRRLVAMVCRCVRPMHSMRPLGTMRLLGASDTFNVSDASCRLIADGLAVCPMHP